MNCIEFRQLKLAGPYSVNNEARQHKSNCRNCRIFEGELQELNDSIDTALTVPVPEGFAVKILLNQSLQPPTRGSITSPIHSSFLQKQDIEQVVLETHIARQFCVLFTEKHRVSEWKNVVAGTR